jgi:serine protease Do
VVPNSPAKKAGLEIGDVIIRFANQRVDCPTNEAVMQMSERIRSVAVNSQQQLVVFRNGREKIFDAQITPRPERTQELKNNNNEFFGVVIEELSIGLAMDLGMPDRNGVYVRGLTGGGRAQLGGLRQQDIVLKINGQDVQDFDQAVRLLTEAQAKDKDGVILFVRSQFGTRFVNISTQ